VLGWWEKQPESPGDDTVLTQTLQAGVHAALNDCHHEEGFSPTRDLFYVPGDY